MKYFALIGADGVCKNALATQSNGVELPAEVGETVVSITAAEFENAIGASWNGANLIQPAPPPPPASEPPPPPPTAAELLAQAREALTAAVQRHLDAAARTHRYDNIHTACGWAGDFADATALKAWGKSCWLLAGQIEAEVIAGNRTMPTESELIALMPVLVIG